ncbi:hypothetical protein Tco_1043629 [Tanacetum coccineum]|uniref:Uncharacterized protein n=1 Tax=Tanacetum coccineum TaxID=301880 RepID=A0ABQ5GNK0_9ASTR
MLLLKESSFNDDSAATTSLKVARHLLTFSWPPLLQATKVTRISPLLFLKYATILIEVLASLETGVNLSMTTAIGLVYLLKEISAVVIVRPLLGIGTPRWPLLKSDLLLLSLI